METAKRRSGYVLHHKDWSLRHSDLERYLEWRIEDLEMMTKSAHMSLHQSGENNTTHKLSEETKTARDKKISLSVKKWIQDNPELAKQYASCGGKAYLMPKEQVDAMLEKRREKMIGKRWVNDGVNTFLIDKDASLPEGCSFGRLRLKHR